MITIKNLRNEKPKENYDIKVDRSSVLGNPFIVRYESGRSSVCEQYEAHFMKELKNNSEFKAELNRLISIYDAHGKLNLFCWCAPKQCHAETIRKYMENSTEEIKT